MTHDYPGLADHSGEDLTRTRRPIHEPGFRAYCPVCGIGHDSDSEAEDCCSVLAPANVKKVRKKRCASP